MEFIRITPDGKIPEMKQLAVYFEDADIYTVATWVGDEWIPTDKMVFNRNEPTHYMLLVSPTTTP